MNQSAVSRGLAWPPGRVLIPILFVAIAIELVFVWYGDWQRHTVFEQLRAILQPHPPQTLTELRSELGSLVLEERHHEDLSEDGNRRITFYLSDISKFFITVECKPKSDAIESVKPFFFLDDVDLNKDLRWMLPLPVFVGGIVASLTIAGGWIGIYPRLRKWQRIVGNSLLLVTGTVAVLLFLILLSVFFIF